MNEPDSLRKPTLPLEKARRLDPICDRFEEGWLAGRRPQIEEFLDQVPPADRPILLGELLGLELHYRLRRGEHAQTQDYRQRFLGCDQVIEAAFASRAVTPGGRQPALDTSPQPTEVQGAPTRATDAPLPPRAGRYRIEREIGRGGMGVVLRAWDPDLHRPLAVKILLADHAHHADLERRFHGEAQIIGQLQHPGIPPIHEVGVLPDGRPFFAMKLIQGQTLADLLHQRRQPAEDLPRWLAIFLPVCQTLAYAHSRGVIHRDLKPSNVMVGAFAEVQVMDWGLAKLRSGDRGATEDGSAEEASTIATEWSGAPEWASRPGALLGTPAYMAPEQARGEVDLLDERCDVFGLGAILCELLTGQPPLAVGWDNAVLARAMGADVEDTVARLEGCGADTELVQLARACLSIRPEDRPRDAGVVTQALADYQAGVQERLRAAERERAAAEARAEEETRTRQVADAKAAVERRARRLFVGLAAVLVAATVALAVGLVVVNNARQETAQALELSQQAEKSAHEQRQLALKTTRGVVFDIQTRLRDRPAQQNLRKALLGRALAGLTEVARAADTATAIDQATIWVHFELGDIFLELEESGSAEAKKQYEKARDLARQVWLASPDSLEAQRDLSVAHGKLGDVFRRLGNSWAARDYYQEALAIDQRLVTADKTNARAQRDLAFSYWQLGHLCLELEDREAARDSYQQALELRRRLADADKENAEARRNLAVSLASLGDVYFNMRNSQVALDRFKEALEQYQHLADADKTSARAQRDLCVCLDKLGDVYLELGDRPKALDSYEKGLAVSQRLADADRENAKAQRDLAVSHGSLADVYRGLGKRQEALGSYKKALLLLQHLADVDRENAPAQRDLALCHDKLGEVHLELGNLPEALDRQQAALKLRQRLADSDGASAEARRELAVSYVGLGDVYLRMGNSKAALENFEKGLELCRNLAVADKASAQSQRDLSRSYQRLGNVYLTLGDNQAARDNFQNSMKLCRRLADADKASALAQSDLLRSYTKLGRVSEQSYDFKEAAAWYGQALDIPKRSAKPEFFQKDLDFAEYRLSVCRAAEQAVANPATALQLPDNLRGDVLATAISALARKDKQPAKIAAAADLLAANARGAIDLYNAACGYALCVPLTDEPEMKEAYAAGAVQLLRRTIAQGYKNATQLKKDADLDALRPRDDFKKLLAELEAATRPQDKKEP